MGPKGWRKFSTILLVIAVREVSFFKSFLLWAAKDETVY